jgi:hypothetical protein
MLMWFENVGNKRDAQFSLAQHVVCPTARDVTSVTLVDVNADGDLDVVLTEASGDGGGTVSIVYNVGAGHGTTAMLFTGAKVTVATRPPAMAVAGGAASSGPIRVALGDVDGDHALDVVVAWPDHGQVCTALGSPGVSGGLPSSHPPPSLRPADPCCMADSCVSVNWLRCVAFVVRWRGGLSLHWMRGGGAEAHCAPSRTALHCHSPAVVLTPTPLPLP